MSREESTVNPTSESRQKHDHRIPQTHIQTQTDTNTKVKNKELFALVLNSHGVQNFTIETSNCRRVARVHVIKSFLLDRVKHSSSRTR